MKLILLLVVITSTADRVCCRLPCGDSNKCPNFFIDYNFMKSTYDDGKYIMTANRVRNPEDNKRDLIYPKTNSIYQYKVANGHQSMYMQVRHPGNQDFLVGCFCVTLQGPIRASFRGLLNGVSKFYKINSLTNSNCKKKKWCQYCYSVGAVTVDEVLLFMGKKPGGGRGKAKDFFIRACAKPIIQ